MRNGEKIAWISLVIAIIMIATAFIVTNSRSKKIVSNNIEDFANIIEEIEVNQRNDNPEKEEQKINVVAVNDINENITAEIQE